MKCPRCGGGLVNYDKDEGGWCPDCQEWFPPDVIRERLAEEEWSVK